LRDDFRLPLLILLSGQNHRWCVIHGEIIPEVNDINIFLASLFAGDRLTLNNAWPEGGDI
jgi:hypothetical protein